MTMLATKYLFVPSNGQRGSLASRHQSSFRPVTVRFSIARMWCLPPQAPLLRQHETGGHASRTGRDVLADAGVISPEARLTILRQSKDDVGFREIFISIDGTPLGMLRFGDTLVTDLPAGPHSIRAHNTLFWKTHHIVVRPGEQVTFEAINRAGWGTFGMLFVIGAMPVYLTFQRVNPSPRPPE